MSLLSASIPVQVQISPASAGLGRCDRALLAIIEGPNLVALNAARLHVLDQLVVHFGANRSGIDQQLGDSIEANVRDSSDGAHRHSLAQQIEDLDTGFGGELSHAHFYMDLHA
jgi:hypothetical protein